MNKILKTIIINFILWVWCFPQMLIGLIIKFFLCKTITKKYNYLKATIFSTNFKGFTGVSLGKYIFLHENHARSLRLVKHEYGHTRQSLILGWTYLIIVGLPSIIMNIISRYNFSFSMNYYKRFPENWADYLGGVKENE